MRLFVPLGIPSFDEKQEKEKEKENNTDKLLIQVRNSSNIIYEEEITEDQSLK